jgi:hypothetical protein
LKPKMSRCGQEWRYFLSRLIVGQRYSLALLMCWRWPTAD